MGTPTGFSGRFCPTDIVQILCVWTGNWKRSLGRLTPSFPFLSGSSPLTRSSDREAPESSGFELDFKSLFDHWEFEVDPVTHVAVEHGWWWSLFDLDSFDPDEHHSEGSDDWRAVFAPHVDLRVTHPLSCKPNTGYTQPLRGDPDSGCQFDESDSDGLSELL